MPKQRRVWSRSIHHDRGDSAHPLYGRWHNMLQRCYDTKCKNYRNYGGRGIRVCQEWHTFRNFVEWTESRSDYSPELQLDRIDNNGDYTPDNCRWVTAKENCNNRRPKSEWIDKESFKDGSYKDKPGRAYRLWTPEEKERHSAYLRYINEKYSGEVYDYEIAEERAK